MSFNVNIIPRSLKLTAILLVTPLFIFAQTLTGLWTGTISNDSNSIRKDQSFEIALTEYRGKVFGYSRSEFIVRDTLYYIVKRVKGTITGDVCEVKDEEIEAYNFPTRLDKGVKVSSFFYRNKKDSTWYLAGKWKTNATKKFFSVTGKIELKEEKDLSASKLFPHLQELNLIDDVAFYKDWKKEKQPIVLKEVEAEHTSTENREDVAIQDRRQSDDNRKAAQPTAIRSNDAPKIIPVAAETPEEKPVARTEDAIVREPAVSKESLTTTNRTNDKIKINSTVSSETVNKPNTTLTNNSVASSPVKTEQTPTKAVVKAEPQKEIAVSSFVTNDKKLIASEKPVTVADNKNVSGSLIVDSSKINSNAMGRKENTGDQKGYAPLITLMNGRKSEFSQLVTFKSDSLELALYDNGEIDGDTVSIFLNGEVLMARQGLKATAIKKTIYLTPGKDDEFTLVLFADNLGKYPPNTGLLVVHDGDDVYNVRFSADLQNNAGVVFRRKK